MRGQFELGELVDELVQRLAHLRHSDHLPDFVGSQIVELLPGQMLFLDFFDHFLGDFLDNDIVFKNTRLT